MHEDLTGMIQQKVDDRNRVALPARMVAIFRTLSSKPVESAAEDEPLEVVVGLGLEKRLCVYPVNVYEELLAWLDEKPSFDPRWRKVRSVIRGSAEFQTLDKQNRLKIPAALGRKLGLKGSIVVQGVGRYVELLSENDWEADLENFESNLDALMGSGARGDAAGPQETDFR